MPDLKIPNPNIDSSIAKLAPLAGGLVFLLGTICAGFVLMSDPGSDKATVIAASMLISIGYAMMLMGGVRQHMATLQKRVEDLEQQVSSRV